MSVSNVTRKVRATGNGVLTAFSFSFKVFEASDLKVYKVDKSVTPEVKTLQTISTDYTVSINTTTEGGTVTYTTAPLSTEDSLITRDMPLTQSTDIPTESNFPETQVENQFDKTAMALIDKSEDIDRSIKVPINTGISGDIELPLESANKFIGWDSAGTALENKSVPTLPATDVSLISTGDARKQIRVNATEDGYEFNGMVEWIKGADVASAGALTLGDDGNFFDITGTTGITSITAKAAGTVVCLQFDGALTITDGSNLKIDGDFTTAAESTITLACDGTNWFEIARSPLKSRDLNIASQAAEDMLIFDGTNWVAKGGTEKIKGINFTRVLSTASGNVAYTGVGFKPSAIFLIGAVSGTNQSCSGWATSSENHCVNSNHDGVAGSFGPNTSIVTILYTTGSGVRQEAVLASFDADGFTLTWTKTGSPTGSFVCMALCIR